MTDYKEEILSYMKERYSITNWPFFGFEIIMVKFGPGSRGACNSLYAEGKIKAHEGIHDRVIELINNE